jgi:hypothetical protein
MAATPHASVGAMMVLLRLEQIIPKPLPISGRSASAFPPFSRPARSIPEERCGAPVLDIGMSLPQIAEVGVGTVHRGKSSATANGNTDPADQQAA